MSKGENTYDVERLYRRIDIGSRWEYPSIGVFQPRGLLDIRDIGHPNWNLYKGLHLGVEVDWKMYNWWKGAYRLGVNQGYLTLGLSAKLGWFNLDLATWGEEVGTYNTRTENRRFMAKFNLEI